MKLLPLIIIIICCIASSRIDVKAQFPSIVKGNIHLRAYAGSVSGASYFDKSGNRTSSLYDSLQRTHYTFDNSRIIGGFQATYGVTDDIVLSCEMPFTAHSLIEKYVVDSIGNRIVRAEMNRTLIDYFSIGCTYTFLRGKTIASILGEYRVPPIQGIPLDSSQTFLGGLSKEAIIGLRIIVPFEQSWIGLSGSLSLRDSAWQNVAYIRSEIGVSTVEQTSLTFFIDMVQAMGALRDIPSFEIRKFQIAEQFISVGASFTLYPDEHLMLDAMYSLRVMGTYAWSIGNVALGVGYRF